MHDKNDPNYAQHKADKLAARELKAKLHVEAVTGLPFRGFAKIARLNRDITITEKIDGTNAAIGIIQVHSYSGAADEVALSGVMYRVYAESRTRLLSSFDDNMGFAAWVEKYKLELTACLGEGLHYGEWWGQGIQRGYDMEQKCFSLFNVERWREPSGLLSPAILDLQDMGIKIDVVPVLYRGPWSYINDGSTRLATDQAIWELRANGSLAAPGYMKPEGIVIFHKASGTLLKATLEGDEKPKGSQEVA
jgi:hypothetical protein